MIWLRLVTATIPAAVIALSTGWAHVVAAPGDPALPIVRALVPCDVHVNPSDLDPSEAPCVDDRVLHDSNARIRAAKTRAANAYVDSLYGLGAPGGLEEAEDWLITITGEASLARGSTNVLAKSPGGKAALPLDRLRLKLQFFPFEQINSYYCGPATVQSILQFLGPRQSATLDTETRRRDVLTGDPQRDQTMFANSFWLATDRYHGTNWGERYVPFTLNAWRGTRWYVQDAVPNLEGGTLTKDQALRNIRYDNDRGYPVAENVLYSAATYYPPGFFPGIRYVHWDTIFGQVVDDRETYVQVGQVYHDQRLPYARYQQVAWDVHWTAIEAWHGIVW